MRIEDEGFIGAPDEARRAGGFSFGRWIADRWDDDVKPHRHDPAHLMLILGGRYHTDAAGETPRDRPTFVYNPPGTFHADHFVGGPGVFFGITIDSPPEGLAALGLPDAPARVSSARAYARAADLVRCCSGWEDERTMEAEALCLELVAALGREREGDSGAPRWLRQAYEALHDRYAEPLVLAELARSVGVDPIRLARGFRAHYGCTPGELLRARRLEKSAATLVGGRDSLAEIALDAGFTDQAHFTRLFRRAYGMPPGAWRRRCDLLRSA